MFQGVVQPAAASWAKRGDMVFLRSPGMLAEKRG
jgi:hypothetical protein